MERTIELYRKDHPLLNLPLRKGGEVRYTLRLSKRARGLRLSVAVGGVLTVTAPRAMRQSRIEEFIRRKSEWVLEKIRYFSQFPPRQVQGRQYRRRHFAEHKTKALTFVQERLEHFNRLYEFRWNKVAIRNQKSRWGSCSRKGNLNFNYKIALLPPHLADYIIVHELCHLRELNHSQKFWALVAHTLPNHRQLRKELRKVGVSFS